jgi:hypothetical protein
MLFRGQIIAVVTITITLPPLGWMVFFYIFCTGFVFGAVFSYIAERVYLNYIGERFYYIDADRLLLIFSDVLSDLLRLLCLLYLLLMFVVALWLVG